MCPLKAYGHTNLNNMKILANYISDTPVQKITFTLANGEEVAHVTYDEYQEKYCVSVLGYADYYFGDIDNAISSVQSMMYLYYKTENIEVVGNYPLEALFCWLDPIFK